MGRTGKLKKKTGSIHSRAARREISPSADVDKSLKTMPRIEEQPVIHSVQNNAGISKRKSKTKPLSRAQRLRQQKAMERAENVLDQLHTKVTKSEGKAKLVNARKAQWEDLNSKQKAAAKIPQELQDDEDMETEQKRPAETTNANPHAVPRTGGDAIPVKSHEVIDEDDEIT